MVFHQESLRHLSLRWDLLLWLALDVLLHFIISNYYQQQRQSSVEGSINIPLGTWAFASVCHISSSWLFFLIILLYGLGEWLRVIAKKSAESVKRRSLMLCLLAWFLSLCKPYRGWGEKANGMKCNGMKCSGRPEANPLWSGKGACAFTRKCFQGMDSQVGFWVLAFILDVDQAWQHLIPGTFKPRWPTISQLDLLSLSQASEKNVEILGLLCCFGHVPR